MQSAPVSITCRGQPNLSSRCTFPNLLPHVKETAMTTQLLRVARFSLLFGIVAVAAEPMSMAGTHILVTYSGTNSAGVGFSGYFEYDQSQVAGSNYFFNFDGSAATHMICFSTGSTTCSG